MAISDTNGVSSINAADWLSFLEARRQGLPLTLRAEAGQGHLGNIFRPLLEARHTGARLVVGQLGQSIDGRIATASGHSDYINYGDAILHLHRLRALVDAVIVGVGTVLADDPQLTVRQCAGPHPARVVIDPHFRITAPRRCFEEDSVKRFVVQTGERARGAGVETIILPAGPSGIAPSAILNALAQRGLKVVLVEGGGITISRMIEAACLDRLHVAVAPLIIGSGRPGVTLPEIATLKDALRPATTCYPLPDGDILFDCDLRRNACGS